MNENKKSAPRRRFKEYQGAGAWQRRKLGDAASVYDGVHQTPDYKDSGIMFLSVENISTLRSEKYISEEAFKRDYKIFPQQGDVLMTRIGDVGTPNIVETEEKLAFYVSLALLKPVAVNSYFLCNAIQSPLFQRGLKDKTLVTAIPQKINKDEIGKVDIFLPKLEAEQKQIGAFFHDHDHLITLHQRRLEKMKTLKAAYLSELFPAAGECNPKRRFKGFTDMWEQRRLGDIVQITMGQSPDGDTYSDTPSEYILVQGNADLKDGWVSPRVWTTQVTKTADAGDLIMSVRAPAGAMGKTAYNAVIGRGVAAIKGNEFIYQLLSKMDFEGYWKKDSAGSTFESLNADSIKRAEVSVPSIDEQEQIGACFRQLDALITLYHRNLEKLQNIKKAYLNEMFVGGG